MIQANFKRVDRRTLHYKALAQQLCPYWRNFKKSSNFESGFLSITLAVHLVWLSSWDYTCNRLHNFSSSDFTLYHFFTPLLAIDPLGGVMFPNSYICRCFSDIKLQFHLHAHALKRKKINIQQFTSNSINNDCVQRQAPSTVHIQYR